MRFLPKASTGRGQAVNCTTRPCLLFWSRLQTAKSIGRMRFVCARARAHSRAIETRKTLRRRASVASSRYQFPRGEVTLQHRRLRTFRLRRLRDSVRSRLLSRVGSVHTPECLREAAQRCRRLAAGLLNPDVVELLEKTALEYELRALEMERKPSASE
jgi:hypothetical protein